MPQISLYIDKETLEKIEKAAAKERISISKWVGKNIKKVIQEEYPEGYFDLFGSITDKSFDIKELSFDQDLKRESL
ncbi:MAG TPA: toxin-antitoxin system, antitoxin component [Spirochaetota bacterium]|nr:toxin-antitoxin system, antitoxin component [Spirochaetota bacterium]HOM08638.1 toxin-antitoxin system, antitoxin component [Spirochaetota bacterium]HPP48457.1 toxin-antitoxin system, antitoxin component [Spirochaetota bacterium]